MKRLEAQFAPAELEEATEEDLKQHPELVPGYIGPMVLGPQAEAAGVKNLYIEIDQESTAFEQVKTRIQTFAEIL